MKSTLKRFLSLVLCMCMVMALLPNVTMTAFAATSGTVTGLADENIGLSFTGDDEASWSANGTSITGAATSTAGKCEDTSHSSTLTITNKKSTTATLSFDYSIEQNSGKIQVDGTEVSSGASFTKELAANESVIVYIQSGSPSAATKITLTNVVLVSDVNATATFVPAENGTYTVGGKLITEEYSNTQSSMTAYQVVATPADGYQFMGWYNVSNGKYINTAAKAALNIDSDCTITARFASKTAALFETGGQRFDDLGDAVSYAQANSQSKITLATNGSISGTYTIPTGITLLIPFDEAGTELRIIGQTPEQEICARLYNGYFLFTQTNSVTRTAEELGIAAQAEDTVKELAAEQESRQETDQGSLESSRQELAEGGKNPGSSLPILGMGALLFAALFFAGSVFATCSRIASKTEGRLSVVCSNRARVLSAHSELRLMEDIRAPSTLKAPLNTLAIFPFSFASVSAGFP